MKAIHINPIDKTVTAVTLKDGYLSIQDAVSLGAGERKGFDLAGYLKGDAVYVHDEGLFIYDTFFELPGCGQGLFAGPALIVGKEIGDTDKTRPPKSTVEEVTSKIRWHDRSSARIRAHDLGI